MDKPAVGSLVTALLNAYALSVRAGKVTLPIFVCYYHLTESLLFFFNPTQRRPACGELHRGYLFPTLILLHAGKVYPEHNDKDNLKE